MFNRHYLTILFIISIHLVQAQQETISVATGKKSQSYDLVYKNVDSLKSGKLLAYYAFDTSRIAAIKNYFMGKQSGIYQSFYPNGKKMVYSIYERGRQNGDYTLYDTTGLIQIKAKYRNGLKHGFYSNKVENYQGRYLNGEKNGKWEYNLNTPKYRKEFYFRGKLTDKRQIFPKKLELGIASKVELQPEFEYEEIKYDSLLLPYNDSLSYFHITYVDRDSLGHSTMRKAMFNHSPQTKALVKYIYNGYVSGAHKTYHPNGVLYQYANYSGGLLDGEWKEYSNKGVLRIRGRYQIGKKHGKWQYNLGTTNYRKESYKNGKRKK